MRKTENILIGADWTLTSLCCSHFSTDSLSFSGPSDKPRNNNAIILLARHLEEGEERTGGGREEWGSGWVQAEKGKVDSVGPRLR